MVVKSREEDDHVVNLTETFGKLIKFHMMLNPEKCVFDVWVGKFLGFMMETFAQRSCS